MCLNDEEEFASSKDMVFELNSSDLPPIPKLTLVNALTVPVLFTAVQECLYELECFLCRFPLLRPFSVACLAPRLYWGDDGDVRVCTAITGHKELYATPTPRPTSNIPAEGVTG